MNKTFTVYLLLVGSIFLFITCNQPSSKNKQTAKTPPTQKIIEDTSTHLVEGIEYFPYKYVVRTPIPPKPRTKDITGSEAIAIAEQWAANQGYMTKRINYRKTPIVFEQGEFATDTNDIIRNRYNTLQPYAFGARQYGDDQPKWAVGFQYVHPENNIGRAVTLDMRGDTAIMQPGEVRQDWIFGEE